MDRPRPAVDPHDGGLFRRLGVCLPANPGDTLTAAAQTPCAYGHAYGQALRQRIADSYAALVAIWSPDCAFHDHCPERRDDGDRAQIEALIAQLYTLTRDEFACILDTFPGLRHKEIAAFGEFQSKRKALEENERLAQSL